MEDDDERRNLLAFKQKMDKMTVAMEEGTLADWMAEHFTENVQHVFATKFEDPTKDVIFSGSDGGLRIYNAWIQFAPRGVTVDVEEEYHSLSKTLFRIDTTRSHERFEGVKIHVTTYYSVLPNGKIAAMLKCPATDEQPLTNDFRNVALDCLAGLFTKPPGCAHNAWAIESEHHSQDPSVTLLQCTVCPEQYTRPSHQLENLFCPEFQRGACLFPEGTCRLFHVHDSGGGGGAAKETLPMGAPEKHAPVPGGVELAAKAPPEDASCPGEGTACEAAIPPRKKKGRPGKNARQRYREANIAQEAH
ncbi:hypothetical protein DIPPA_27203 [Diplonema papillatum]|nr:hypothetical protein DIPPA_27203 [Diplonema papillatum]